MAPEQYIKANAVDQRADIYALGMTPYGWWQDSFLGVWAPRISRSKVKSEVIYLNPPPFIPYPTIRTRDSKTLGKGRESLL